MKLEHSYTAKYEVTKIIHKFLMIHDHALMIHYEKYDQQVITQIRKFTVL
jgi:hypothetical protein